VSYIPGKEGHTDHTKCYSSHECSGMYTVPDMIRYTSDADILIYQHDVDEGVEVSDM